MSHLVDAQLFFLLSLLVSVKGSNTLGTLS